MLQIKLAITTKKTKWPSNSLMWNRSNAMEIDFNKDSNPSSSIKNADDFKIIFLKVTLILVH